jgi:mannose-6-phosphate isomerase-like protein (cupin superfamily)
MMMRCVALAAVLTAAVTVWGQTGSDGITTGKSLPTEAQTAKAEPETPVNGIDRRSSEQLATQARTLLAKAKASPSGSASVTLETYPGHLTMLTVRTKSGGAERHRDWNDMFVVLDGEATEMTGGTIVDAKENSPGETRGKEVSGGRPTPMRKGDVIHISPNTPHQTILEPGKTFTYYVIKIAAPKS